jgi:8-oxo-dGTP diphosphatase
MKPHPECPAPHVGVGLALSNSKGELLFGLRKGGLMAGSWAFPGGKVDIPEDPDDTAIRECVEETGIPMESIGNLMLTHVSTNELDGQWYVTIFFSAHYYPRADAKGPLVMEPDACAEWRWFARKDIPEQLMPGTRRALAGGLL